MTGLQELKEHRCYKCDKLLAKGEALMLELKCPRCKAFNVLRASRPKTESHENPKCGHESK